MPDLLIELHSEEIPARMQRRAAGDLRKLVTGALVEAGLTYEGAREYWTPRRLALDIRGLTARSADLKEEKKGPRVGSPQQAIDGFLRSAGLASIDQAQTISDPKKGEFYVAYINKPGRDARAIIANVMPQIVSDFPWPKSMRWGEASKEPGSLRWVRPLKSMLCMFGSDTQELEVIPFEIGGLVAGDATFGHRFLAPDSIYVRRFDDYVAKLEAAKIVLDAERRKQIILADARNLAFAQGYELVEDEGLLEEVANLVEWPVVLIGEFDEAYLALPDEVTRLTIRENQKCFVLRQGDKLANRFVMVSNINAPDGGKQIARGNAKVVRARLSDAKFFYESDLQIATSQGGFDKWIANLDNVTFHAKLGSQGERVRRITALARELAPLVGADPDIAARAAHLAKADLQSAMVFEFPELQGRIGRLYAQAAGESDDVARAVEEHYSPLGPSDGVPSNPVSIAVALADKLDTLVGFWAIDEKPTGSKDPYALRRAALGVIRLVLENGVRVGLNKRPGPFANASDLHGPRDVQGVSSFADVNELLAFFHDRLKVFLRDTGARHDLIDAVLAPTLPLVGRVGAERRGGEVSDPSPTPSPQGGGESANDDLLMIVRKVRALQALVESTDGTNLIAGYKRAANILAAEAKKGTAIAAAVDPGLFETEAEKALFAALGKAGANASKAIETEKFEAAMAALAMLRAPIDAFFDGVMVNADDASVRANRLALLAAIRAAIHTVADFSKIAA